MFILPAVWCHEQRKFPKLNNSKRSNINILLVTKLEGRVRMRGKTTVSVTKKAATRGWWLRGS